MKGLLRKDFYNLQSQLKIFIVFFVMAIFFALSNHDIGFLNFLPSMTPFMLVLSSSAYDELSHFETYALSQPIKRLDFVIEKYSISLLSSFFAILVSLLLSFLLLTVMGNSYFHNPDKLELIGIVVCIYLVINIINAFIIPCIIKFGTEKARYMFIAFFLSISALGFILTQANLSIPSSLLSIINDYFLPLILVIFIIIESLSFFVSIRFINQKEF
ncbi:MAG: ABC-2 transporter permease [Longicatena sp.]